MSDLNYKSSGVDVDANAVWTKWIAQAVKQDRERNGIFHVGAIGGFAGAMKLPQQIKLKIVQAARKRIDPHNCTIEEAMLEVLDSYSLVACTDGVGTKTMIAEQLDRLDTIGYDLLAMNVNDMVAGGAIPIAFLDYIGCHGIKKIDGSFHYQGFVEGLIEACRSIDVELVGGETAEMKANYTAFGSDLTGFALGILLDEDVPPVHTIKSGDVILALPSSGVHSNGYSLVRSILTKYNIDYNDTPKELNGKSVADVLLEPTRLYVKQALNANATKLVKSMAHITGGGLMENLERALPKGTDLKIVLDYDVLPRGDVFEWIDSFGIDGNEMLKTFNMGYGFAFIADGGSQEVLEKAVGEPLFVIGEVI